MAEETDWGQAEQRITEIAAGLPLPETPDLNLQLSAIQRKIAEAESIPARPRFFTFFWPSLAMAAVMGAAFLVFWKPDRIVFETQPGQILAKTLADGSSIDIRAGSNLVLLPGFNEEHRNLELQGEAFFHVAKGEHPFRIHAGGALITVLGTQFNVACRDKVVVGVSEGRVRFSTRDGDHEVVLTAGMEASFSATEGLTQPASIPVENFPAWKQGVFVFQNAPLASVCAELERHFAIRIQLHQTLSQKQVTGRLRGENPEDLVEPLSALVSAQWRHEGGTLVIEPAK